MNDLEIPLVPYDGPPTEDPPMPYLPNIALEELLSLRELVDRELSVLRDRKTLLDQELLRRFRAEHPALEDGEPGSRQIAGEKAVVTLTWYRDYDWREDKLAQLMAERLLTQDEYDRLVRIKVEGNGTQYNALLKRGGRIAELLNEARIMRKASPRYEAKERS